MSCKNLTIGILVFPYICGLLYWSSLGFGYATSMYVFGTQMSAPAPMWTCSDDTYYTSCPMLGLGVWVGLAYIASMLILMIYVGNNRGKIFEFLPGGTYSKIVDVNKMTTV